MYRPIKLFLAAALVALTGSWASAQQRVACVGNSVTYGYLLPERETTCYPNRLQELLGSDYQVANFGHSGATLLNHGHRPYMNLPEFKQALEFKPDIVVIHLGLNDTDPRNWPNYQDEFVGDYTALIDSFRVVNPKVAVYVCRLSPIFHWHPRFQSGTRDWYWQVQEAMNRVAANNDARLIDLREPLHNRPDLMPDALHPDSVGARLLARQVYQAISGDCGGLQMPLLYTDGMVLQRDRNLRIAGTANVGEKVTVKINRQKKTATAGIDGAWAVELDPMQAGGPYELTIEAKSGKLTYSDVLVGEVWLCSGQSNMAFRVNQAADQAALVAHAGRRPAIRIFNLTPMRETYAEAWEAPVLASLNNLDYFKPSGWMHADSSTVGSTTAVGYAFAAMLSDSLGVPVGIIHNALGGSPAEAWIDRKTLEFEMPRILYDWRKNDHIQQWVRERASQNIAKATNPYQRHPYEPAYLFETGIEPLAKYPIRGAIWYQGESNAHNIECHEALFPLLVDSWRQNWGDAAMPFYYVQLSSLNRPSWPLFRDSQRRLLASRPALGMAVSSDRGDSTDVHPRMKQEVGQRLAAWALHDTYGHADCVPSGPLFRDVVYKGGKAIVSFDYAEGLAPSAGTAIIGFEIADETGVFHPAKAEVKGQTVQLSAKEVKKPAYVRYGWQPFTRANLVNGAGMPASTFRSAAVK